jgi:serine/threonine protein kinase
VGKDGNGDRLEAGQRLGPFLLLTPLGCGGSGLVWAAVRMGQLGFTKRMALKVMRRDRLGSDRARERFDREALLGAQLRHSNLRAVHELGRHEGRPYMAMAWVDTSLVELIEHAPQRRLEPKVVCWLGVQVCAALSTAHSHVDPAGQPHPIVHGDVSPGNILLTKGGHVQLADLAADVEPSQHGQAEGRSRHFFGSLSYASPEALKGLPRDARSDLFSLGCVLYEALGGGAPFEGDDERSVMFQVLERPPIDISEREPSVPEALARVVRRAMQRRLEDRFRSADEMREALVQCVQDSSAFELEGATSALIERVLGGPIRAREEQMRGAYQEFSAAQLAKTDTLPVGGAVRRERVSAPESLPSTSRDTPLSSVGAASAVRSKARRLVQPAAGVLALVAVGYASVLLASKQDIATENGDSPVIDREPDTFISTGERVPQIPKQLPQRLESARNQEISSNRDASSTFADAGVKSNAVETKASAHGSASVRKGGQPTATVPSTRRAQPGATARAEPLTVQKGGSKRAPIETASASTGSTFKLPPPDPYKDVEAVSPSTPPSNTQPPGIAPATTSEVPRNTR